MATAKAPSELPQQTPEPQSSVANEENRGEDGFLKQPTVGREAVKGPFLVGKSDIGTQRRVTRADFESVGIDQDTLIFDWRDGYKLPVEGINPAAVKYLVNREYGFSVVDE